MLHKPFKLIRWFMSHFKFYSAHTLSTTPDVQFKKEIFDDPHQANQYLSNNFNMPPFF
ncbi:hypothetical protein [Acinetobacter pittii]|uniref:hypothetical protein n=1 Tax=Acinetobacter pittii TaxID=48296 RepID=UPI001F3907B6|nr:hypothetical protein [Acinetobacter pittii]